MSGGMSFVSLKKILNFKRILQCRSLIKDNNKCLEEDVTPEFQECVTMIQDMFDARRQEMAESALDDNSVYMTTKIAEYVVKKFIK